MSDLAIVNSAANREADQGQDQGIPLHWGRYHSLPDAFLRLRRRPRMTNSGPYRIPLELPLSGNAKAISHGWYAREGHADRRESCIRPQWILGLREIG
jgi:hypothetical protein